MAKDERNGVFEDILVNANRNIREISVHMRNVIQTLDPMVHETVWPRLRIASYGVGPSKMKHHYAYVSPQANHVNLGFYHAIALPDPRGLLEGTGKSLRHVKIASIEMVNDPAISELLEAAITERLASIEG